MNKFTYITEDIDVTKVSLLSEEPMRYAVHYTDGHAILIDGEGNRLKSPMDKYDEVSKLQYVGRADGVPHYAFDGRKYGCSESDAVIMDALGCQKRFIDPILANLKDIGAIQEEFIRRGQ